MGIQLNMANPEEPKNYNHNQQIHNATRKNLKCTEIYAELGFLHGQTESFIHKNCRLKDMHLQLG